MKVSQAKKRYKAVIADQTYTIIGPESTEHMDLVTKLVNDQLSEIRRISPQIDTEQAAILLAINTVSDQVKQQEQLIRLTQEVENLRHQAIKVVELENRIKRIEALEAEAKEVLERTGRSDVKLTNHVEAQQIINEERKRTIEQKNQKR